MLRWYTGEAGVGGQFPLVKVVALVHYQMSIRKTQVKWELFTFYGPPFKALTKWVKSIHCRSRYFRLADGLCGNDLLA
jgi:hypothetical protein